MNIVGMCRSHQMSTSRKPCNSLATTPQVILVIIPEDMLIHTAEINKIRRSYCATTFGDCLNNIAGIYILAIPPPPLGEGKFLSQLKNREEFEGGLEKRKGKGGGEKKEKNDKTHVKYLFEALMTAKKIRKNGEEL